jgi:hypothetical protein
MYGMIPAPRLVVPDVTYHAVVRYAERVLVIDIKQERRRLSLMHTTVGELDFHLAASLAAKGYSITLIGERLRELTEPARKYGADYMTVGGVRYALRRGTLITVMPTKRRWRRK